jgi:hypothetical protein
MNKLGEINILPILLEKTDQIKEKSLVWKTLLREDLVDHTAPG